MLRQDGRSADQMRPLRLIPNYSKYAHGSVIIELGDTRVLCTVCVEDGVPPFLRGQNPPQGWLTAEYSMLPGSTSTRSRRERPQLSGRTQEIQRLIGRALRGVVDLNLCPDMTFLVDCDVLQADGGTRTASITGAYVAFKMAVDRLLRSGKLRNNPLRDSVTAISVGYVAGRRLVDLNYLEDSKADLDMNVVLTGNGKILEIQGTGEKASFSKEQVMDVIDAAEHALGPVFDLQIAAADGREVES